MTTALPTPKKAVALIEAAFKQRDSDIATKDAYNLLAQLWGHKDWATASAALKKQSAAPATDTPTSVLHSEVADWPIWVVTNRGGHEDEPLYIYPYGTRLENLYASRQHWSLINDSTTFSMEVPTTLLTPADAQRIAGEEVACEYPDSEEYGVPACASEAAVDKFLAEELGFSYLASAQGRPLVEVCGRCRGDDGMTDWWVQIRVHPEVHARLVKTFTPARCEFERAYQTLSLSELLALADCLWSEQTSVLAKVVSDWFDGTGHATLNELVDRLYGGYSATARAEVALGNSFAGYALSAHRKDASVGDLLEALASALTKVRTSLEAH